jgi:ribosomal protein S27E
VPLIRCSGCGKSSFTLTRRSYVARCPECGKALGGHHDTARIESEIRERLYGRRADLRAGVPIRG